MLPLDLEDGTIDAGLYLFDLVREKGRIYSQSEIAIVCGCTSAAIGYIEARAMEKIALEFRKRLRDLEPVKPEQPQPKKLKQMAPTVPFHHLQLIPNSFKTKNFYDEP